MTALISTTANNQVPLPTARGWHFASLATANAAAVAALYWNQAIATSIADEFPDSAGFVSLIPFATLAGYAAGVGTIAFVPSALGRVSMRLHLALLAAALFACSLAPNLPLTVMSSVLVGAGSAVAQRLLAAAGRLAGPNRAGAAIGMMIAAALVAVLGVRLAGDVLAKLMGWRTVLMLAGACVAMPVLFGRITIPAPETSITVLSRAVRHSPVLWRAALQQAGLFAAYSAGWMTLLIELPAQQRVPVIIGGGIAGLLAAMLSGRLTDRFGHDDVAGVGATAVMAAASLLLPAAYATSQAATRGLLLLAGMMLLDAGLQAALVANQARVQALLPAARTRLAALVTVCGALGGALGAGTAYWLWHRFGWGAAISVAVVAGALGFACSCPLPGRSTIGWLNLPRRTDRTVSSP